MILQTQYSASKHAVKGFTDGLRMELERDGAPISVTLIKPSAIDTPIRSTRNYMKEEPALPPYDPHLVAKAVVYAAETSRRELTVGFGGWLIAAMDTVAPRLTDKVMELAGYSRRRRAGPSDRRCASLPRPPGRRRVFVASRRVPDEPLPRRQMHPLATATVLAGIAAAVTALLLPRGASSCRRGPHLHARAPLRDRDAARERPRPEGHWSGLSAAPGRLRGPRAAAALTTTPLRRNGPEAS